VSIVPPFMLESSKTLDDMSTLVQVVLDGQVCESGKDPI